ncbi:MAG: LacI family transcriptional regulator [Lachnospiraceae bacterium]|nr:LacI family transcriptional regulator [Lachnospiraceae bacterium]
MSLKKIAEMTGVSVSTVSRVLNNRDYNCASEELKERIWEAAEEIRYIPNESARNLKKGNTSESTKPVRNLAVVLERFNSLDDDPFFRELYRSVEQEAFACGCTVSSVRSFEAAQSNLQRKRTSENVKTHSGSDYNPPPHEALIKTAAAAADGYIILGRCRPETLRKLKSASKNIVSISRNPTQFEVDEIICDGRSAAVSAVEYLIRKGFRCIGYIGDCSYEDRYVGYCDTMIRHGLPLDYANIIPTDQTAGSGCEAMKKLLTQKEHPVEAVFCANDATAIGALQGWREYCAAADANKEDPHASRSPSQLPLKPQAFLPGSAKSGRTISPGRPALISIDDIREAAEVTPPLTTVHVPCEDMGKAAVKVLLDRMKKGHAEHVRVEFPSHLVIRESC